MKKTSFVIFILFFSIILTGCSNQNNNQASAVKTGQENKVNSSLSDEKTADKLEVYYFHGTARCVSCMAIGEFVAKTMSENFSTQMENGLIDYREINVDLPENKEIAKKFKASGSSLFINRIKDGQDNIEQDTKVWQLTKDEMKFKAYLKDKIDTYLGL